MASQVLSGSGDVTYTNNTGQNVRIVINYLSFTTGANGGSFGMRFGSGRASINTRGSGSVGRSIAGSVLSRTVGGIQSAVSAQNFAPSIGQGRPEIDGVPLELVIAPEDVFSIAGNTNQGASIGGYNIVVIPEAG